MRKLLSTAIAVGIFTSMSITPALAGVNAGALPNVDHATNADITVGANSNMNIQIQGGQGGLGSIQWKDYNIGKDATVNYEFTAHNQTALNKVNATGGLSQIYGRITASGCAGCGYDATGKVILINPNGVLFGESANVNLNSFTVSTMDGTFDKHTNELKLDRNGQTSKYGILVLDGAKIHGDKAVNFASDNVAIYNGSQISTNVSPNFNGNTSSYGKVKIVTADGVNFVYYNQGAVKKLDNIKTSADKMVVALNGDINAGNIDIRNHSTNTASEINIKGSTLKATKAVSGNDGNIWLTANNRVIIEDSNLTTNNYSSDAASRNGGNVQILAGKKVSIGNSNINAVGNVDVSSQGYDVVVDKTTINAKDINVTAKNIASVQNNSKLNGKNVKVAGDKMAQVVKSTVVADNIEVVGNDVWTNASYLKANKTNKLTAKTGNVLAQNTVLESAKNTVTAKADITGSIDAKNTQTNLYAGKDINVKLANVGNKQNGLVAEAGKNVTLNTDGTLSVSRIVANDGDVTLTANNVVAGLPYTDEAKIPGDNAERSYIYAKNGKFTSNTANDSYEVTASDTITADGKNQQRHHIQYGNGSEKILLITNRPYVKPVPPVEPEDVEVDDQQASMLNKLPRQPQTMNNATNIADGRTTFVDVFAAASQIEIEDDEDEE